MPKPISGRSYKIGNCASKTWIDLNDSDKKSIIGYQAGGGANQLWTLIETSEGPWALRNCRDTNKYLGFGGKAASGTRLIAEDYGIQLFNLQSVGNSKYYSISVPGHDNLVIDMSASSSLNGNPILIYSKHGGPNQQWELVLA
ncbi:ricin B lectin domain-containing protein [Crepidotus variabilis]|uniref:Ricin B lectin domain-containing protein n=1 Tax=Crepidotus variabilis TaxID=179855 RepID=A0A9P6JJN5_9AGAR|nr:ricin B lectin domain-containing protein [Crepidotus variabilis]